MYSTLSFRRRIRARRGQTLVEFALILAMIVVLSAAVLINMGSTLHSLYSTIDSQVARATAGP